MRIDRSRLAGQARYWALHCSINALPSFIVAVFYLQMIEQPLAVVALLLAVLTFMVGYTILTSIDGLFCDSGSVLSRSLKVGVKIRLVISLISLPLLFPSPLAFFVPDVWAGMVAAGVVNWCGQILGTPSMIGMDGGNPPPLAVYVTAILEGLIISLMLMMLSFFSLLVIQGIERKKKAMEVVLPLEVTS